MKRRVWHKGPPPHIGWWNANYVKSYFLWRWWDGKLWSLSITNKATPKTIRNLMQSKFKNKTRGIEWTDYWPKKARVPRIDPRKQKGKK